MITNKMSNVLYIGMTNDLERRLSEHRQELLDGFTKQYRVNKLVYYEVYGDVNEAIAREKQIKKWRREKKDVLVNSMNPDWFDLSEDWYKPDPSASLGMTQGV
jgi:putative endonuclease